MKFLPNLLRQNTFCFKKCIFLLPSAICFSCSRSSPSSPQSAGGLTCHKVFTGYWILQFFSSPGPGQSLTLPAPLFAFLQSPPLLHRHRHLTEQQPLSPSHYREYCKYTSCLIGKHFIHCSKTPSVISLTHCSAVLSLSDNTGRDCFLFLITLVFSYPFLALPWTEPNLFWPFLFQKYICQVLPDSAPSRNPPPTHPLIPQPLVFSLVLHRWFTCHKVTQ